MKGLEPVGIAPPRAIAVELPCKSADRGGLRLVSFQLELLGVIPL
jgi:hypothetical protein